jgi:GTP cyclohydrolase IB
MARPGTKTKKRKASSSFIESIPMSIPTGEKTAMVDVHAVKDRRGISINRVGVENVSFPLIVRQKSGGEQNVHAKLGMYGSLLKDVKGTNMSRFIEELLSNFQTNPISGNNFKGLLTSLQEKLQSDDAYIRAEFNYFVPKMTPATHREHLSSHKCRFIGQIFKGQYMFVTETNVYVASYCPCSKEMCLTDKVAGVGKGAHAQRGLITLQMRTNPAQPGMWLEDMIKISEESGSAQLYPLLKRPDEKFVTEQGYDNPKYVEDIARDVMVKVKQVKDAQWARVKVTNEESIHPHDVSCLIEMYRDGNTWRSSNRGHF